MSKRRDVPRTPFRLDDRYVYLMLVAVSIMARLPFLGTYDLVSYDGTYYINQAKTILGIIDHPLTFPIGYPFFIALFIPLIRDGVRAAQTVSFLAGLGSLFVFYSLAKQFVQRGNARLGVFILALTPLFINLSMVTMSESLYIFWVLLGFYCFSRNKDLSTGLSMGMAAITRSEALGIFGVLAILRLRRPKKLLWMIGGFACLFCVNVAVQSISLGKPTIYPHVSSFGSSVSNWRLREAWVDFPGKEKALESMVEKSDTTTVLVDYLTRMPREVALLIKHVSPVIFLLSLYGIYRKRSFLLAALVPFFAFAFFTFRSEPRFIFPYVPLLILYSFIGLEGLRERPVYRPVYALLFVSAAAFLFFNRDQLIEPVSGGNEAGKYLGVRLKDMVRPWDKIADRKPFFSFYAGGRYVEIPLGLYDETMEYLAANGVNYLFLERALIDVARPGLKPLLYDRAVIAGEMRFSQFAFAAAGTVIYKRAMESDPLRRRTLVPPVEGAIRGISWSPDGKKIAYRSIDQSGAGGIYIISPDGDEPRLLVADSKNADQIAWAPDSKRIAFAMNRSGTMHIYVRNESGSLTRVTSNPGRNVSPSWSKDGKELIFCSDLYGQYDIWSKNLDTGALTQITKNGGNTFPSISPDGRKIAWIRAGEGVCIYERKTGVITLGESPKDAFSLAWSPDGKMLAVMGIDWGQTDIYLLTADGRNALLLTKSILMGAPAWSPDGQALAVATLEEDKMGIAILTGIQSYKDRLMNPPPIRVLPRKP